MKLDQKRVLRELLNQSIQNGFGCSYPLKPIADKFGITEPLYDNNTNTGLLWEFGPHGSGLIMAWGDWPDSDASIDYHYSAPMIEAWTHRSNAPVG
jgi:hypothetical protein